MANPSDTLWEFEAHTKAKLSILRKYLEAWFPIMLSFCNEVFYIDGFAGPGEDVTHMEDGSPVVALKVAQKAASSFTGKLRFLFIEERQDRLHHLEEIVSKLNLSGTFDLHFELGSFTEKYLRYIDDMNTNPVAGVATFAFLDDFGFSGLPFSVITKILGTTRREVFINFPVSFINRFLEPRNDAIKRYIVDFFGTEEALKIAESGINRVERLRRLYYEQLKGTAQYVQFFEMRNDRDQPIYDLFFATNHPTGFLKMKIAMWKVDPEGTFSFSDSGNPDQLILLRENHTPRVAQLLSLEFRGKGKISGEIVKQFIEYGTFYLNEHKTTALRRLEKEGEIKVDDLKSDGTRRKSGSFPDEVQMTFL